MYYWPSYNNSKIQKQPASTNLNSRMQHETNFEQQLNKLQYISHWVPLTRIVSKCTSNKSFVKLRKFKEEDFKRKHQMIINHLYIQRLYLIAFAMRLNLELELSNHYYIENGLIFGVYHLKTKDEVAKPGVGISMSKEVQFQTTQSYFQLIQNCVHDFCQIVQNLNFSPAGEYEGFIEGINKLFNNKIDNIKPQKFIQEFQKWPLAEHYVYNVKLKNSMLMPTIFQDQELLTQYRDYINLEKKFIVSILNESANLTQVLAALEEKTRQILAKLEKRGKIAEMTVNYAKTKAKARQKEPKQPKQPRVFTYFRVILSPSRSQVTINQKEIEQNSDIKGSKPLTKIQIKPQNGLIAPVNGNVITVSYTWEILPEKKNFTLKIECFNNRKVEQMYFDEIFEFWTKLQNNEQFSDLVGADKYSISLNSNKMMEVTFENFVLGCMLSASIREIDKIVALAIALDEIVEMCERKGVENEDPKNYQIEGFMIEQTKQRFKKALKQIESNSKSLFG